MGPGVGRVTGKHAYAHRELLYGDPGFAGVCFCTQPQQLAGDLRTTLDACLKELQQKEPLQQQVEWYSHGIPVDNLNVYRVNWPTA